MARSSLAAIDWDSGHDILVNPRWPERDQIFIRELAHRGLQMYKNIGMICLTSSGTSSKSFLNTKLVFLRKSSILKSAEAVNDYFNLGPKDIWGNVLPQFHVGGLSIYARACLSGSKVIELLGDQRWNVEMFIENCTQNRVSLVSLVPTQVFDLIQNRKSCPQFLKIVFVGGGVLTQEQLHAARDLGWPIITTYGMTETSSQIAISKGIGAFEILPHAEVRVNARGLIEIKSPSLLESYAYFENGKEIFQDPKQEGWLITEDQGVFTQHGLSILGRKGDFFKIGGENTSLTRLNNILLKIIMESHDLINKSFFSILDGPSDRLGKEVYLVVQESVENSVVEFIIREFNLNVLPFERIRDVKRIDQIPYSDLGKLKTGELKEKLGLIK